MAPIRALLIDDDEEDRDLVQWHLEDAGLAVVTATGSYAEVQDLVDFAIAQEVDVTICDHRLQPHRLATFYGAEVVAGLTRLNQVAILITSYQESDAETSIRQHRRFVPAVVARGALEEVETFNELIRSVRAEIDGEIPLERQLHKTVVRIGSLARTYDGLALDVFVDGWRPDEAVRIPAALLPSHISNMDESDLLDAVLSAEVNTAARSHEEIYFGAIEGPVPLADWEESGSGTGNHFPTREGYQPIVPLPETDR